MSKIKYIILLAVLVLSSEQLFAWGATGHRIVAQVAYDNLNCRARHRVERILGKHGIIYWSDWADNIKSDTIYPDSYDWHYQNLDPGLSDSAILASLTHYPAEGGNLFKAMDSIVNLLRHERGNVDALRFLIHLAGDFYCPMHLGHFEDLGGNTIQFEWFKQPYNLHRLWDEGIIVAVGYSYSEYAGRLEDVFGKQKKDIRRMTKGELLLHNYNLVQQIYAYQDEWNGNPYVYVYHFAPAMEWQLYVAGIRLAKLLNELYG